MIEDTSIASYATLGSLKDTQQRAILAAIKLAMRPSSSDLSRFTHIPRTSVTGRLKELEEEGLIYKKGKKIDPHSRKTVWHYALTTKGEAVA